MRRLSGLTAGRHAPTRTPPALPVRPCRWHPASVCTSASTYVRWLSRLLLLRHECLEGRLLLRKPAAIALGIDPGPDSFLGSARPLVLETE